VLEAAVMGVLRATILRLARVHYRQQRGLTQHDISQMECHRSENDTAEISGVLFTADPVSGDRHTHLISCARGTGDQVVNWYG